MAKLKIIVSALRFAIILVVVLASISVAVADDELADKSKPRIQPLRPHWIEFNGDIDWQKSKFLRAKIQQAKNNAADLIVIEIDSPGGLKTESLNLAETIRDIDWAYTVAYVPREALSGAALMTFGFDELIVTEKARIGDIGVIQYDPQLFAFRFAPEKIQSVLIRQARDLATSKGRSADLAEAMIDKDYVVYSKTVGGELEFKGVKSDDEVLPAPWRVIPESKKGFLTINGLRAQELGLATKFAEDKSAVADDLGFELREARKLVHTTTDSVVYYLNHPVATGLLILIGLVAFFVELSAPGIGFGGLVSGLCAALFFWSRFLGGTSTWLEIVLFTAGVTFLLMEVFVIPGWGVSGITGVFLTISSVFLASQDFIVPDTSREWNQFLTSALMMLCSGALFAIAAAFIVRNIGHVPIFSKLMLPPPDSDTDTAEKDGKKPAPADHPAVSVGDWGQAESLLRPAGRAIFFGRSFDVVSDGEFIEAGQQVKVIAIQGNRIVVSGIRDTDLADTTA